MTPATGTTYQRQVVSFTLPTEFLPIGDAGNGLLRQADFGAEKYQCYFSVAEFGGADITGDDIDDAAKRSLATQTKTGGGRFERRADRQIGGREAYVLTGSDEISPMRYQVGAVAGGKIATLTFAFTTDSPDNQALIESILATVTWTA